MPSDRPYQPPSALIGYTLIGSEMAGFTVVGVGIDWLAGTAPWATVGLTLTGAVVAFLHLIQMSKARAGPGGPGAG